MPIQAQAKTFHTDVIFHSGAFGPGPSDLVGTLAEDAQERLYGVSERGGTSGFGSGIVYRLTPGKLKSDPWTSEILHDFSGGADGNNPIGGVYVDASGAVYGTTNGGGTHSDQGYGNGVVYRLDNAPGWPLTILHTFGDKPDGQSPQADLQPGQDGRLYGTTVVGGQHNRGTVFAISPQGDSVTYEVVHSFGGAGDGSNPRTFTIQKDGAIYGLTSSTAVFRLVERAGTWDEHLIYAPTGRISLRSITNGPSNTLYLCSGRGKDGYAIQLSPPPISGSWIETDLYRFERHLEGCFSLTINPSGGFLGTTESGGSADTGTIFSLTQSGGGTGAYTSSTLHSFSADYGMAAESPLLRLGGLYYGATQGNYGSVTIGGTVFDIRP